MQIDGQENCKFGSYSQFALDVNFSIVSLDDVVGTGQSHRHSDFGFLFHKANIE